MKNQLLFILLLIPIFSLGQINPENIDIVRDQWGVPHIYAKTDAEVAYGLAWATAEDDFKTMQETLLPIRGKLGSVKGPSGAALDLIAHIIDVHAIVDAKYETDISPKFRKITEAFAAGANAYAATHPKEILIKGLFPIDGKDLIKSYVFAIALLADVPENLARIVPGTISLFEENLPEGSNAFALNSNKTADGHTYLAINPHQPLQGPYSWYEAHLVSEEGLNVLGSTLVGGMHISVGTNENLAWTHTVNHADFTDVYKLQMHPSNKLQYMYDRKWETLKMEKVKLKVKLLGLKIGLKRKIYRSKHGVVYKSKNGNFYALKFTTTKTIGAAEQWYKMNKAKNFTEWKSAVAQLGIPTTNLMYADKDDNIFYTSLGLFPRRNPKYNWKKVLPGNTSEVVWEDDFYPFDSIFQIENPPSGYLGNSNHTPFNATVDDYDIPLSNINPTHGYYLTENNNRALRFHHLMQQKDKITFEEFRKIKFDTEWQTPLHNFSFPNLESILHLDAKKYPHLKDCIELLNNWDRKTNIENKNATIFSLTLYHIIQVSRKKGLYPSAFEVTEPIAIKALEKTQKHLKKHFKTVHVPLGDWQKLVRGDKEIPIWGSPDVIAAMHPVPHKKGKFKIIAGESYIGLIRFTPEGVKIETSVPYGSSNHKDSPHYADQMELYRQQKLKKMTLDKEEIIKNAKRTYHPK